MGIYRREGSGYCTVCLLGTLLSCTVRLPGTTARVPAVYTVRYTVCVHGSDSSADVPDVLSVEYCSFEVSHLAGITGNKRCFRLKRQTIMASEVYST